MSYQKSLALCERMYQRHKAEVVVGQKTAEELLRCAEAFVDLEAVEPREVCPNAS